MSGVTTNFSDWDFYNYRVAEEVSGGQFVSAETTLIAAGAPSLSLSGFNNTAASTTVQGKVYPVGLLESFGLQQNKQLQRLFEIGASRSYFVPGRVMGSITLGRAFYYGSSLLKVLYAYYSQSGDINFHDQAKGTLSSKDGFSLTNPRSKLIDEAVTNGHHKVKRSPGEDFFFIDLASDLFSQPTGMAVYFKDYNNDPVGGMYLEECYVQGHQLNISAGSVLIMEGASLQYEKLRPIKLIAS